MINKWSQNLTNKPTILYENSLRSGQRIDFDGNVVVLGDVNAGAEIVAGGHILVMGTLRGLAHAGSGGDEDATVTALTFAPTQVRIASHITRPPEEAARAAHKKPEIARVKEEGVVIEEYQPPR
ncbi:MAG: septum site-determining protein MinC [Firmicutes bacterium]|jgi:septum site-determining protein MinC|nr:septum site-determining protein MinC [Bacillota bacterium]